MGADDTAFLVWVAILIIMSVFLFAGTPDVQDALIGFITNASGGR